jgi:hypothetical protein
MQWGPARKAGANRNVCLWAPDISATFLVSLVANELPNAGWPAASRLHGAGNAPALLEIAQHRRKSPTRHVAVEQVDQLRLRFWPRGKGLEGGTKSGEPSLVTLSMKAMIAFFGAVSFQDGSGSAAKAAFVNASRKSRDFKSNGFRDGSS